MMRKGQAAAAPRWLLLVLLLIIALLLAVALGTITLVPVSSLTSFLQRSSG